MKKIIFYFLALLFAVWAGMFMHDNPGYVLISTSELSVETSLWVFVIGLVLLFSVVYLLVRLGGGVARVGMNLKKWFDGRRKNRAYVQTTLGLYDLVEGDWKRAEKRLIRFAKYSQMSLLNYLAAALAAERQREFDRRDKYLRLAQRVAQDRPLTASLAEATLKIGNGEWEKALPILENLNESYPKNGFVLDLLQKVYLDLSDWHGLKKILPSLRKRHVLEHEEADRLEERIYGELLLEGAADNKIDSVWSSLSRSLKRNPYLLAIYSEYLLNDGKDSEAEDLLKMVLRKNLDDRLLRVYSRLTSANPIKHLMRAEKWLPKKPNDVGLLLCLARICRKQKLWGKARHYLEESIKIEPYPSSYVELAELMVEQNDLKAAVSYYEKATDAFDKC